MSMICNDYLNSVVCIGVLCTYINDGKEIKEIAWCGTGFFVYKIKDRENKIGTLFLVTCRHVAEDSRDLYVSVRKRNSKEFDTIKLDKKNLFFHENKNVDLAIFRLNVNDINNKNLFYVGFDIDLNAMSTEELNNEGAGPGNLLYMLGFPSGLKNENQNPICRLGCISRMDKDEIQSSKTFLVDVQGFPGESGSPIIIRPDIVGVGHSKVFNQSVLIGLICSYIPYQEYLRSTQTQRIVEMREENSGIARVVPIEFVRELINSKLQ